MENGLTLAQFSDKLKECFAQVKEINLHHRPFHVYRGVDFFEIPDNNKDFVHIFQMIEPFVLPNNTFCSSSVKLDQAERFAQKNICCLLKIDVPSCVTRYLCTDGMTAYPHEKEIIFPPGVHFMVYKKEYIHMDGKKNHLLLYATAIDEEQDEDDDHPSSQNTNNNSPLSNTNSVVSLNSFSNTSKSSHASFLQCLSRSHKVLDRWVDFQVMSKDQDASQVAKLVENLLEMKKKKEAYSKMFIRDD